MLNATYDAIVIGAGAGGGVAACVLAEAGLRVLVLERGGAPTLATAGRDHLRNHRLSQYGHNVGPELDGNPRVFVHGAQAGVYRPHEPGWFNNAMGVGGGTAVYGAQAWRFLPDDFRMASRYGVPAGSSLADWPIRYADLEPYYENVEWAVGVCGDSDLMARAWPRARALPMPAVPTNAQGHALRRGANALGWPVFKVPLLINSEPYGGRAACNGCNHCVGFHCEVDAKNGTQNTLLPRALATGNCTLITHARVHRITIDARGQANGVTVVVDGATHNVTAARIVLAAGAIESARLLLLSRSSQHPHGLGNAHDQVGRNLQGHYYPGASGFLPDAVMDNTGPGVNTACVKFNHGNTNVIGGGMLADEFIMLPIIFWKRSRPADAPNWGLAAKCFMRENFRHAVNIKGPVQEIPSPDSRVTLDPSVVDNHDLQVARLSGTTHPETVRTAEFMRQRAIEWMQACNATRWWSDRPELRLSAGQHQAGTCRMGHDPATSVVDANCRVHGQNSLFVSDGSVHVTNGGFNPVLTIMALAWRTAEAIARS